MIYFAEKEGGRERSWTFMESFWFGLMALTSVGNGDKKPNTSIGKVAEKENKILRFKKQNLVSGNSKNISAIKKYKQGVQLYLQLFCFILLIVNFFTVSFGIVLVILNVEQIKSL